MASSSILAVVVLHHWFGEFFQLLGVDPSLFEGYFLQTSHFKSLSFLNHLDEGAGFRQTVVCSGVEPCKTSLQGAYLQHVLAQIMLIDGGYL